MNKKYISGGLVFVQIFFVIWWIAKGNKLLYALDFHQNMFKEIEINNGLHYVLELLKFLCILVYPIVLSFIVLLFLTDRKIIKDIINIKFIAYILISPLLFLLFSVFSISVIIVIRVGLFILFLSSPFIAIWYFRDRFENPKRNAILILVLISIVALLFSSRIRDGFTPVDTLTEEIYENSVYEYNGSVCRDGTISSSQGRGTCSWHDGVRYKFYKGQHKKTKQECQIEAKKRSWLE